MRLVLLGPPGSGKGTQAKKLSKHFSMPHIATGDLLREHVAKGDDLGRQTNEYMTRGELVPDEVVLKMVEARLAQPDCRNGFIFDGFPRTLTQAQTLKALLDRQDASLDAVMDMQVPEEEIVRRLSGRRICMKCGEIYHVETRPPKVPGSCDMCGSELTHRADDEPATIRNRLLTYHRQTEQVLDFYRTSRLLRAVSGGQPPDEVFEEIRSVLMTRTI